jgi:hypothetical protein
VKAGRSVMSNGMDAIVGLTLNSDASHNLRQ